MTEATLVKNVLTDNGIPCWMAPDSIPIGSSYASEIKVAIENCTVFVLVLSEKAQSSAYVEKELDSAITGHKIVYPFMIENCKLNDAFDFYLSNVQRHNAFESKSAAMEKMVREIKALFGATEPGTPIVADAPAPAVRTEIEKNEESVKKDVKPGKKNKILDFLLKFTPYGREYAKDKRAKFAMNTSTVIWAVLSVPMSTLIEGADYYNVIPALLKIIIAVLVALLTWHVSALSATWISKLPIKNKFIHGLFVLALCAFLTGFVVIVVNGIAFSIVENVADSIYFGY